MFGCGTVLRKYAKFLEPTKYLPQMTWTDFHCDLLAQGTHRQDKYQSGRKRSGTSIMMFWQHPEILQKNPEGLC